MTAPVRAPYPSRNRNSGDRDSHRQTFRDQISDDRSGHAAATAAPGVRPEPRRQAEPSGRPPLHLVGDALAPASSQRNRARIALVAGGLLGAALLLGVVAFHAVLVSGQLRLDGLQQDVTEQEARYQALRLQVAELEAPDRIVEVAQGRLGMVEPPEITYLTPVVVKGDVAVPPEAPRRKRASATWETVKPLLGGDG